MLITSVTLQQKQAMQRRGMAPILSFERLNIRCASVLRGILPNIGLSIKFGWLSIILGIYQSNWRFINQTKAFINQTRLTG